ncbi:MAG: 30S ribosomal protein S13 [Candidatus Nanoarchaeia archaeon]|nr:30S ribosomal protein S13 [Candidatus Nanoarchaeia archaeon]
MTEEKTIKNTEQKQEQKLKGIIRILGADIKGHRSIEQALWAVKGVSQALSHAVIRILDIPAHKKAGSLTKEEIEKIEDVIKNPKKYNIPSFMFNRRKDYETGEDVHVTSTDYDIAIKNDLKNLVETRSYRGLRHSWGLPVRGQRTKAGYTRPPRRIKRRGNVVGVSKKKQAPATAGESKK